MLYDKKMSSLKDKILGEAAELEKAQKQEIKKREQVVTPTKKIKKLK